MSNRVKNLIRVSCLLAGIALVFASLRSYAQQSAVLVTAAMTCTERLLNGGFESDEGWSLPVTAFSATYSTEQKHTGNRSVRAGIVNAVDNKFSYSSTSQTVQIPTGTQTATLSLWNYALSTEGDLPSAASVVDDATIQAIADGNAPAIALAGDRQYVLLTNAQNTVLARLLWTRSDARSWQPLSFDLTAFAGQSVRVLVGVYNDGVDGVTASFVDDASLVTCLPSAAASNYLPLIRKDATSTPTLIATAPTTQPTLTPTPTPASTRVWTDPPQAIEVFSPVADGLYHSPIEINGFSQTFEASVNLRLTDKDGLVLAERSTLGGAADGFAFFDSYLRFTVGEMISGTVEVFEVSAKDGSEIHKVTLPVVLLPGQRVIDLNAPGVGEKVCNPVWVQGYSNTFEANVGVTLNQRDGTQLAFTTALGGNLGLYADFSTLISHTVTAPQPVLAGAYEGSPAGFGLVDYTLHPIELHPTGAAACGG